MTGERLEILVIMLTPCPDSGGFALLKPTLIVCETEMYYMIQLCEQPLIFAIEHMITFLPLYIIRGLFP